MVYGEMSKYAILLLMASVSTKNSLLGVTMCNIATVTYVTDTHHKFSVYLVI